MYHAAQNLSSGLRKAFAIAYLFTFSLLIIDNAYGFTCPDGDCMLQGDADGDGDVDGNDLIAVQTNFGSITPPPGDADHDGDVDGDDLIAVQGIFGFISCPFSSTIQTSLPSDADGDGDIDGDDLIAVQTNFGSINSRLGDADGDGDVDGDDLIYLQTNFGNTASATFTTAHSVPEPSTVLLVTIGFLASNVRCQRCFN